jgi:predicted MPP superfamily phosphohydrolase
MELSELIQERSSQSVGKHFFVHYSGLLLCLGFLVFNVIGLLALSFRLYHFFRTIFILYVTNVLIFPAVLVLCVLSRRILTHSWKLDRQDIALLCGATALVLVFVYASLIEPTRLQVETIDIASDKVTTPFTVLHISDIQSGMVGRYEERVFRQIQALQPDLIVHTGDLLHSYAFTNVEQEHAKMAQLLRSLNPPHGIYNIIGDTDWRLTSGVFDQQAGIQTLQNESRVISIHGTPVHLLGLSHSSARRGDRSLIESWHRQSGSRAFSILFGHAPDYVLDILDLPIDLALAGHTHGGQIRLPFIGPLVTLSRVPKEWAMGYRKLENIRLNVSAGIGAEHNSQLPPIRVNCPPTMTLFTVRPAQ